MAISKIILNGVTQMDVTGNTVTAATLFSPKIATGADGETVVGTAVEKTLTTKSITANGTYNASSDNADGYSSVTVSVSGGGGSSWTLVAEKNYTISTTSTSAATVETWNTGHPEIWTSSKFVYVRIRDNAGKRAGYFYGSDNIIWNVLPINQSTATSANSILKIKYLYNNNSQYEASATNAESFYGVYVDTISSNGSLRVRRRYSSSGSLTINGEYNVRVYLLDAPSGAPIYT